MLSAWCERVGFAILEADRRLSQCLECFPSASAMGLCCRTPAKHSSLTEPFGMELPKTDLQNGKRDGLACSGDLLQADSCRCWRLQLMDLGAT